MAIYTVTNASGLYQYCNGAYQGPRASAGDIIQIANLTAITLNSGEINPPPGVTIQGAMLTPTLPSVYIAVSGTNHFNVRGSGTSDWYSQILISGIYFQLARGTTTGSNGSFGPVSVQAANVKFQDCLITDKNISNSDGLAVIVASGYPTYVELHNSTIQNVGGDCLTTHGVTALGGTTTSFSPSAQQSYVKLYNCSLSSAGQKNNGGAPTSNDKLIETNEGIPVYVYGGTYQNGNPITGNGPSFVYFAKIDPATVTVGNSGQSNTKAMIGAHVFYGNYIIRPDEIRFGHHQSNGTANTWGTSQAQLRRYGLFKGNYVQDKESVGSNNLITSLNNGNMILDGNIWWDRTAAGSVVNKGFFNLTGNSDGTIRNSGMNVIVRNNMISTDATVIKATSAIPLGSGFTTEIYNNTFFVGQVLSGNDSGGWSVPSGHPTVVTYFNNNLISGGNLVLSNTVASFNWGSIRTSGNVINSSSTTGLAAPTHINSRNSFSTWPSLITGSRFAYTPASGSNLSYGSGVTYVSSLSDKNSTDSVKQSALGTNWIGAKAPQLYTEEVFPTFVVT